MVTILPLDVDEQFVRDALAAAVAARVESHLRKLTELVADLRASGVVRRPLWHAEFAALAESVADMRPVMEYARCFEDQWPDEPESAGAEGDGDV